MADQRASTYICLKFLSLPKSWGKLSSSLFWSHLHAAATQAFRGQSIPRHAPHALQQV